MYASRWFADRARSRVEAVSRRTVSQHARRAHRDGRCDVAGDARVLVRAWEAPAARADSDRVAARGVATRAFGFARDVARPQHEPPRARWHARAHRSGVRRAARAGVVRGPEAVPR